MLHALFLIYNNALLCKIEKCLQLDAKHYENEVCSLLFADDYIGLAKTGSALQILIDCVHNYSKHWFFETNVKMYSCTYFNIWKSFR